MADVFATEIQHSVADGNPTEEEKECAAVVTANILASFDSPRLDVENMLCNPFPGRRNYLPILVFARNEDAWNGWTSTYGAS